jgi:hypothetical protein
MGIVEAIIAAVALIAAAGITAGSSASASEELRGGQKEAAAMYQKEAISQERQKQLEYGLGKQSLELEKIGVQEQARQNKRAEDRAIRQEKRTNMASFYAKANNFLNDEIGRNDRLRSIWG